MALPEVVVDIWSRYQQEVWLLGIASAAMLVISAIAIPYLIVRLPADFYVENDHPRHLFQDRPLLRILFLTVKNAIGAVLAVAGILMLVLPGQGILTILAALALLNFPGKRKMEMRILHRPAILKSVNWLRKRAGREPLAF
jgi:uncharacterized membrane protein SpoIIM required for sporulation